MRARSPKQGRSQPRPIHVIDLDKLEADFWDRAPDVIHTELSQPGSLPSVSPQWRETIVAAEKHLTTIPEPDRQLLTCLPLRASPILARWRDLEPAQRQAIFDWIIRRYLQTGGPGFLATEGAQRHLASLWKMIQHGTIQERTQAKKRWEAIFTGALPNLRGHRDPHDLLAILEEYEAARARLRTLHPQGTPARYSRMLRRAFPAARERDLADLAEALHHADSDGQRKALLAIVGTPHNLAGDTLRELLAEARRRRRLEARIREGQARYTAWCTSQGIPAHPA